MAESLAKFLPFIDRSDVRGGLMVIEEGNTMPFLARRAYWVYATAPEAVRGSHAHRRLHQLCFCVAGSVTMRLFDGLREEAVRLEPGMGSLLLPPMLWHEMLDFSPDCVLAVFADAEYDEADYIRDREAFVREVAAGISH